MWILGSGLHRSFFFCYCYQKLYYGTVGDFIWNSSYLTSELIVFVAKEEIPSNLELKNSHFFHREMQSFENE